MNLMNQLRLGKGMLMLLRGNNKMCEGCDIEMQECYNYQQMGYDAGLTWFKGHCFFYAMDSNGNWVAG